MGNTVYYFTAEAIKGNVETGKTNRGKLNLQSFRLNCSLYVYQLTTTYFRLTMRSLGVQC